MRGSPLNNSPPQFGGGRFRQIAQRLLHHLGLLGTAREIVRCWRFVQLGLRDTGWRLSARVNGPVNSKGEPIPWFTYPAIWLLEDRLPAHARVFEWGAGHSTIWWARRVVQVVSVESDPTWAAYIRSQVDSNVEIRERPNPERYIEAIREDSQTYDIIVVDGLKGTRYACGRLALERLSAEGVIVWDNAEWTDFQAAWLDYLCPAGFRRLSLRGFGPCGWREWETAIIYREGNILGI